MSTTSDQENSECSNSLNSPTSYTTLESPQSSPLQQVPQLTTTLTTLSRTDKDLYRSTHNGNVPFLRITEQPQNHFRFRYDTEKSGLTHGSILGKSYVDNKKNKKTHPTVELVNYSGKAVITCSVKYDTEKNIHQNIYKILEDEQNSKTYTVPKSNSYRVGFPGIGVHTIKKSALCDLLYSRLSEVARNNSVNTSKLQEHCSEMAKSIDQNIVRLKFSAHDLSGKKICEPVLSDPILNKKSTATNALKICRMSMYSGRPSGGDDLFLLVDKIDKNEVQVRFYEKDESGKCVWSAWGSFAPSDVHYQCAIVCRTPQYRDLETPVDVKIWIELVRNGSTSEPKEYMYKADPVYKQYKRRKIAKPYVASTPESNFSAKSLQFDQPVITLPNDINEFRTESAAPLQPVSTFDDYNIISSSFDILDNGSGQGLDPQGASSPMWSCALAGQLLGTSASQVPPYSVEVIAAQPAQLPAQLPTEPMPSDVAIEEDISQIIDENALTEYASVFDMCLEDLFQSEMEDNALVGDSGRIKVDPSTSSPQTTKAADSGSHENDVARTQLRALLLHTEESTDANIVTAQGLTEVFQVTGASEEANIITGQGPTEVFQVTEASEEANIVTGQGPTEVFQVTWPNIVTGQGPTEFFLVTGASEEADIARFQGSMDVLVGKRASENPNEVISQGAESSDGEGAGTRIAFLSATDKSVEASETIGAGASGSAGEKAGADYPASFNAEDAAEIQKLVRELCEIIREKKSSKSELLRSKLERLFEIRLSNGDTFLHMTLFKSQRSFEALVKMIDSVKMSHLLNYANNRGETILHLAVIHGSPDLVSLLVAKGCEPAARNCEEESAVHYAVRYAGAAVLRALLDAAARAGASLDLDAVNAEKQSALHLCAVHGRASCAALLGARGASGGVRDAAGRTPLHLCAYDARVDVARAMLPHAAPHVDARDAGGRTPLAVVCACADRTSPALELARALLAAGARAEFAWRAAVDHPQLRELLNPHMPPHAAAAGERGGDIHSDIDEDDVKSESDDEYESADDTDFIEPTPEALACKLGLMGLTGDADSTTSHFK